VGTFAYWPPERFQSVERYDSKCDIWSYGITLLELLYRKLPYKLENGDKFSFNNYNYMQNAIIEFNAKVFFDKFDLNEMFSDRLVPYEKNEIREFILKCVEKLDSRPTSKELKMQHFYQRGISQDNAIELLRGLEVSLKLIK